MDRCEMCQRLERIRRGDDPSLIRAMRESVLVLGDNQGSRAWCVLIAAEHVEHLDAWPSDRQAALFRDVADAARAIRRAFPASGAGGGPPRINYECLGNVAPHVHWHVIPRHADDPAPRAPVWGWDAAVLRGGATPEERAALVVRIRARLDPPA